MDSVDVMGTLQAWGEFACEDSKDPELRAEAETVAELVADPVKLHRYLFELLSKREQPLTNNAFRFGNLVLTPMGDGVLQIDLEGIRCNGRFWASRDEQRALFRILARLVLPAVTASPGYNTETRVKCGSSRGTFGIGRSEKPIHIAGWGYCTAKEARELAALALALADKEEERAADEADLCDSEGDE